MDDVTSVFVAGFAPVAQWLLAIAGLGMLVWVASLFVVWLWEWVVVFIEEGRLDREEAARPEGGKHRGTDAWGH
ncbi:hypothetical protein [Nocardioides sp.]|uniref:hypothetical protein n=1 Tax=Nocardioides sp. TaxID=35761 RepID=UPI0039E341AB